MLCIFTQVHDQPFDIIAIVTEAFRIWKLKWRVQKGEKGLETSQDKRREENVLCSKFASQSKPELRKTDVDDWSATQTDSQNTRCCFSAWRPQKEMLEEGTWTPMGGCSWKIYTALRTRLLIGPQRDESRLANAINSRPMGKALCIFGQQRMPRTLWSRSVRIGVVRQKPVH